MKNYLLIIFVFVTSLLNAQKQVVSYLTVEDGLTQNEITGIVHDTKGFMWFATRGGLNRYDGYEFVQFKRKSGDTNSLSNPSIECLYEDSHDRLWIGTKSGGVDLYNPKAGLFRHFRNESNSNEMIGDNRIISINEQKNGNMWFGGWSGGLTIWNEESNTFEYHLKNHRVSAIKEDANGNIWIGTNKGIYAYDSNNKTFTRSNFKDASLYDVNDLVIDSKRNILWVTAWNKKGLIGFDLETGESVSYMPKCSSEPNKVYNSNSYSLLLDSKGEIYMGTWGGGLYRFNLESKHFSKVNIKPGNLGELNTDYDIILKIIEDKSGAIWIGTDGGGVCRIGNQLPFQGVAVNDDNQSGIKNFHVLTLIEDKDSNVWLGTKGGGLYYSEDRKHFIGINNLRGDAITPDFKVVKCIYETLDGTKWVGTDYGLHQLVFQKGKYYLKNQIATKKKQIRKIQSLFEKDGVLFLGTQQHGFWLGKQINTPEENWKQFVPANDSILRNERISLIQSDNQNRIWVGSYKGIYFFDDKKETFAGLSFAQNQKLTSDIILSWCQLNDSTFFIGTPSGLNLLTETKSGEFRIEHFYQEDGLPDDYIHALVTDNEKKLWISTNSGVARFNPKNRSFNNYDKSDGLQGRSFSEGCVYKNATGEIYFGGASGFNYFQPNKIRDNQKLPKPAIIGFSMHNKKVSIGEELHGRVILEEDISHTQKLELTHREREFTLTFSALGFDAPERNNYAYRLLNYDDHWNYSGTNRTVTYNQLRAGKYIFEMKASNNHSVWNEEPVRLHIKVIPAPWKSWWAIMIYIFIALGLVALIRWVAVRQSRLAHSLELESVKVEQAQEINEMKLRFFTNISHEFRTPLTLILAPATELLSVDNISLASKNKLRLIEQNSRRLLRLVGQLLDFRKAETGKMEISVSKLDLVKFLKQEIKGFQGLAENNQIKLSFHSDANQMILWFDIEKMSIVMNNLLANAFKYVSQNGEISVKLIKQEKSVKIAVRDNGKGIPQSELNRIFDRFYQVDSSLNRSVGGSGIGLAITKKIVELHHGSIMVESIRDVETVFSIDLLLGKEHFSEDQVTQDFVVEVPCDDFIKMEQGIQSVRREIAKTTKEKCTILIVEDQEDINNYITDLFQEEYNVIQKFDGIEGYANCMQTLPDLIISDVMMPGMDGFEFCEKVKKQERTAHIPVILLTAKTADQFKIKGITTGADAYITKPFNTQELLVQVQTLLKCRKILKNTFSKKVILKPTDIEISSYEEEFLNQAVKIVEDHMDDHDFNAEVLASSLNMSTSTLYRKLKLLSSMSTNVFIRSIRLKRATQLLADPHKTIAEISVQVGIADLKYFRKCFRDMYGSSPSEYRQGVDS
ncbi:hybrid sensor histidine kinase/response regulator transcription factor [Labilibaculum antarcticum]|uniref:histidine kinase n=1 Tax=Labilibaculum antarcticum TaxID=1717717 RepID=A0A1Y1CPV1_9BACT|nr:two-component regulator propeller domain-containing protein [Labilibaculum antarcticum]BAX82395.1 hybrid sensor histidine kinase/response regulator [Labilibaculum antarcticum]